MKKWIISIIVLLVCLIIVVAIFKNTKNVDVETTITEYVPQEEISVSQNRMTILTLYFKDSSTGELMPEARQVDVKEIISEPYKTIMNFLIEGPNVAGMEKIIPEGTKLNSINLEDENLIIDLSKEFIDQQEIGSEEYNKVIYSIVNTFLELKEVSSVSFLIDGEKVDKMSDPYTKLDDTEEAESV